MTFACVHHPQKIPLFSTAYLLLTPAHPSCSPPSPRSHSTNTPRTASVWHSNVWSTSAYAGVRISGVESSRLGHLMLSGVYWKLGWRIKGSLLALAPVRLACLERLASSA